MAKKKDAPPDGDNKHSKKKAAKREEELTYQQSSLQAIDAAPEPKGKKPISRHAVSAADILSQSLSNLDNSSHHNRRHRRGSNKDTTANNSSQSFIFQGSSTSLLAKGPAVAVSTTRRRSYSETSATNMAAAMNDNSNCSVNSPKSEREYVSSKKRTHLANKEAQDHAKESLAEDLDGSSVIDKMNEGERAAGIPGVTVLSSNSSADSYDPEDTDNLELGLSESETQDDYRTNIMSRQISNLSGGKGLGDSQEMGSDDSDDYDEEDEFPGSVSTEGDFDRPMNFCGIQGCRVKRRCIKGNRIASAIVRYAPCFWCFPIPVSATDRTILTRLNIISSFFAVGQMIASFWIVTVMLIPPATPHEQEDDYATLHGMQPNLWSLTGVMYAVLFFAIIIFVSNLVTLKVIQVVNLIGAIRYLWVLLYLLPFEIFFVLSLFDFYNVTHVWIKHWWLVPSMAWFRETYCEIGTAGTLCMVPIYPDDSTYTETDWCIENYQATNCTLIRDTAQMEVEDLLIFFYNGNVAWGIFFIMILLLIVNTLERIISRPLVQKSRESNVPAWLSLPTMGCSIVGAVFRYSPSSVLSARSGSTYSWIGTAYMASGVLFFLTAMLGWFISTFSILSGRDKRYKHISVIFFIFLQAITSFILTVIFVASISYSVALVEIPIDPEQKGTIACGVDTADSCSNCDGANPLEAQCPEWSLEDVTSVLQTQTKASATIAIIFFLYAFSALRFGFVLRKHVTMYQIDYV